MSEISFLLLLFLVPNIHIMKPKIIILLFLCLFFSFQTHQLSAQCTAFNNGPFPVPELPVPFCGQDVCGNPFEVFAPVQTSSAFELLGLIAGNTYDFSLCNFLIGTPNLELILVDPLNPNVPIFASNNCNMQFIPPNDGDYWMIINEFGQPCPNLPPQSVAEGFEMDTVCPGTCPPACNNINRTKATMMMLDPLSGVEITFLTNVWSPMEDFGFGFSQEGLLPAGTEINPAGPSDCAGIILASDAYFFWLDDMPFQHFVHSTRFVLVDANSCNATVDNGDIIIAEQEWWPIITLPDLTTFEFFDGDLISDQPPSPRNLDGLINGDVPDNLPAQSAPGANISANTAAGLVVTGSKGTAFGNDVKNGIKILQDQFMVNSDSIRMLGDTAITKQQFCDAIDDLAKSDASKFYIVMSGHGNSGVFEFKDMVITKQELCTKFKKLAKKGKPICLIIDACLSGSLLDADKWGFPEGSVIITSANSFRSAWSLLGSKLLLPNGTLGTDMFTESAYFKAHNTCLKDANADLDKKNDVDNCEAHKWVKKVKPCYAKPIGPFDFGSYTVEHFVIYPAGSPNPPDTTFILTKNCGRKDTFFIQGSRVFGHNPMPQIQKVGKAPKAQGTNAQNKTGASQTSYGGLYQGDLSTAMGQAFFSDVDGNIGALWANSMTTSYDPILDQTLVTWTANGAPALDLDFIYFQLEAPTSLPIIPLQQFWGAMGMFLPQPPILEPELYIVGEGHNLNVVLVNKDLDAGGLGLEIDFNLKLHVSDVPLPLPELVPNDPFFLEPPILSQVGTLPPDGLLEIPMPVPDLIEPGQFLIVELCTKYPSDLVFNTLQLSQWKDPLLPPLCSDMNLLLTSPDLSGIDPVYFSTSGSITVDGTNINSSVKSVLNAGTQIQILPPATISSDAHLYIFGCDGSTLPPENNRVEEKEVVTNLIEQRNSSSNFERTNYFAALVPNPFRETVMLQYELQQPSIVHLTIYNLQGQRLSQPIQGVSQEAGNYTKSMDLSTLSQGIYFAVLRIKDSQQIIKLVKE